MKSIGDVGIDDIKSDVAYVKEREKTSTNRRTVNEKNKGQNEFKAFKRN
jgi:hypothetical protein